jgi:hypothetical protein
VFLDQVAMNDADRWMEIAVTMTLEVAFEVETSAAPIKLMEVEQTEMTETAEQETTEQETTEPEMIEAAPRARVLSITQLRQKLGIEEVVAPPARTRVQEPMTGGPPRIVSRRRDVAMQEPELMAG